MRNILVEIVCRRCFYHTHIKSHTLVLPEMEPKLRTDILEHRMFTYECPRCHEPITFIHNFLYHDVPKQFLVYMSREQKDLSQLRKEFPYSRIRQVSDPEDLSEQIRIMEDGLDDEALTRIKEQLLKKDTAVKRIRYHDHDVESQTIWLTFQYEDDAEYKAIHDHTYEQYSRQSNTGKGKNHAEKRI